MEAEIGGEYRVYGPPGCGKTTWLSRQITRAAQARGSEEVFVASFTKTAAVELVGRNLPISDKAVGTLHSHCYRAIGDPTIAEVHVEDFNTEFPHYALSSSAKGKMDEAAVDTAAGETDADALLNQYNILRNKMIPKDQWSPEILGFANAWETFKENNELLDFTDLIETAYKNFDTPLNAPTIGFIDECQDLTPLQFELVRKWGRTMERLILVGDPDQCQPAGTMVSVVGGEKPIEELDPEKDRLISYCQSDSRIYGERTNGYGFKKAARNYSGRMFEFNVGGRITRSTDNHIWIAKWTKEAKKSNTTCVYLMQKGEDFRVGWCQLFNSEGSFHVNIRARLEGADRLWILRICKDKGEASVYESYYSTKYGIVLAPFREVNKAVCYTKENLELLFSMVRGNEQKQRVKELLLSVGRDIRYPFWDRSYHFKHYGGKSIQEIRAVNVLEGLMDMGFRNGSYIEWVKVDSVSISHFEGEVYSLDVDKYHTYISDGIVTHNCLFDFTGASPEPFITPIAEENKRVLAQSYRVPRKPHALALKWIRRCSKRQDVEYYPTDVEGAVKKNPGTYQKPGLILDAAEQELAAGKSVMLLTNCSYQLQPVIAELRRRGLPFHNPYRMSRGDWNPLARRKGWRASDRLLAFLEPAGPEYFLDTGEAMGPINRYWTPAQLGAWTELCKTRGLLNKGARDLIKETIGRTNDMSPGDMENFIFDAMDIDAIPEALRLDYKWLLSKLSAAKIKSLDFPVAILESQGREALREEPRIIVGTVHSVKGGEAECHPAGEPILTTNGYVPIESLNPDVHRLAAFNLRNSKICRGTKKRNNGMNGYKFTVASRDYAGRTLTLSSGKKKTTVTMNHHLLVRFNDEFFDKAEEGYATYLMKKGNWFRVGMTKLKYGQKRGSFIFGPTARMHVEEADAMWITGLYSTQEAALVEEDKHSYFYGIPQLVFKETKPTKGRAKGISQSRIDATFNMMEPVLFDRATKLLEDCGLDIRYPFKDMSQDDQRKIVRAGKDYSFIINAINFVPGLMKVPVDNGGPTAEWVTPEATYSSYAGKVYSLEVLPTHYYIAGGVIVHNCVFYMPDVSLASWKYAQECATGRDSLIRQGYVAFTRCRETLVLCSPCTKYHMGMV